MKQLKIAVISSTILLLIFLETNPKDLPSVLLIVPFGLIFCALLFAGLALMNGWATRRARLRTALIMAIVPVVLLILQSLGQLTVKDLLALAVLSVVTYFYIARASVQPTNR